MDDQTEHRFKLTIQYDGTYFLGWQLQARGRTVQGEMEAALKRLTGQRRAVLAAGRTDSGVHATGQVASVTLPTRWGAEELFRALNAALPEDIWVAEVTLMTSDFHPRFHACARSYRYQLGLEPVAFSPFHRPWCWPLIRDLDLDLLHQSAALILGDHSFKAFAKVGQEARGHTCRVTESEWVPWPGVGLAFEVTANRFLHHMVRYLVGTMVEIARERRPLSHMADLVTDPTSGLITSAPAPPEGLFLSRVHYPDPLSELD